MMAGDSSIRVRLNFAYATNAVEPFLLDVDLHLPGKGVTAIWGASGSGKTSLLKCIAGLQKDAHGDVVVNGEIWQQQSVYLQTHRRALGYVFQDAHLFDHLTAQGNLEFALKRANNPKMAERYQDVIALLNIQSILHQFPKQLSGGERQRVAIARALLIDPKLLLMDEPLASLDSQRKHEILPYLEQLPQQFDLPIIYVSHSIDEVARLADYLVVLDHGRVIASGAITDVLSRIDLFLGLGEEVGVLVQAKIVEHDRQWNLTRVRFAGGDLWVRSEQDQVAQSVRVRVLARDVGLSLSVYDDTSILNRLAATICEIAPDKDDAMALLRLRVGETMIIARITRRSVSHLGLVFGRPVWAQIKSVAVVR